MLLLCLLTLYKTVQKCPQEVSCTHCCCCCCTQSIVERGSGNANRSINSVTDWEQGKPAAPVLLLLYSSSRVFVSSSSVAAAIRFKKKQNHWRQRRWGKDDIESMILSLIIIAHPLHVCNAMETTISAVQTMLILPICQSRVSLGVSVSHLLQLSAPTILTQAHTKTTTCCYLIAPIHQKMDYWKSPHSLSLLLLLIT